MRILGRIRLFCWRRRWSLSVLYLLVLGAVGAGMALILFRLPHGVDLGLTIAARAVAYHRSFAAVELAQEDLAAGHLDDAERRLRSFLAEHTATQPGQLATHAVTDGHLLLAEVYLAQGRSGRALKRLREMAERTPKNYYVWFRLGRVAEEAGDLPRAREALHRAFLLALDHPEVTEAYLGVLKEQVAHEQILWVADHFQRAQQRAAPQVEIKVGAARSDLQRRILDWVGIPAEHASFVRTCLRTGLPRGESKLLELPAEMLVAPESGAVLALQLRFEGIYDDLQVEALRYRSAGQDHELRLSADAVSYLHRPHSGVEFYAEMLTDLQLDQLEWLAVVYSCPEHRLSAEAEASIDNARRNKLARGAGP